MFSRVIRNAMCQASRPARLNMSTKTPPPSIIKKYPVILNFLYPSWEIPAIHRFYSEQDIEMFLSERKQFLFDPLTGDAIRRNEIHRIDPNITYEVAGSGLPYRPKFLKRDQVWDKIFERKTAAALKEALDAEGEKFIELSRVVKDPATGQDVGEWEVILKTSDGTLIFLETKYRMSKKHIDEQFNRISKSLSAMGNDSKTCKLYLAAYYWPDDDDLISYGLSLGYGIIRPNGSDSSLTVHVKAKELCL